VDYLLRTDAAAFLIRAAALVASASFSNPNIAEYLRPTTCAITKVKLIPASPIAFVRAWPSPYRLSSWTSRAEIGEGARLAVFVADVDFLPETGCCSITAVSVPSGVAIGHDDLQVGTRFRKGLERIDRHAGAVIDLFAPQNRFFYRDSYR
jgi:hypothetical protein